jgi:hypothetical protein
MDGEAGAGLRRCLAAWVERERAKLGEMRRGSECGRLQGSKRELGRVGGRRGREFR